MIHRKKEIAFTIQIFSINLQWICYRRKKKKKFKLRGYGAEILGVRRRNIKKIPNADRRWHSEVPNTRKRTSEAFLDI